MKIIVDDLSSPEIAALLKEHLADMHATSPAESVHALDLEKLKQPDITFYSAWRGKDLLGCAAIKHHSSDLAEIKSMRTSKVARSQGVASRLLQHVIELAMAKHYQVLSLETGTQDYFQAARNLYTKFGFVECDPFADYQTDPNSAFMTLSLKAFA